jgi:hypothetical protein
MLLKFHQFPDEKASFELSLYELILSKKEVKTDEIYPIVPLERIKREDLEDTSIYILDISINKEIGCIDTDHIFYLLIVLSYISIYTIKTEKTTFRKDGDIFAYNYKL